MDSVPLWRTWGFWRRVLLFISGAATLAGTMLDVTPSEAKLLAYGVALVSLALSLIPDAAAVRVLPGIRAK